MWLHRYIRTRAINAFSTRNVLLVPWSVALDVEYRAEGCDLLFRPDLCPSFLIANLQDILASAHNEGICHQTSKHFFSLFLMLPTGLRGIASTHTPMERPP